MSSCARPAHDLEENWWASQGNSWEPIDSAVDFIQACVDLSLFLSLPSF